MRLVHSETQVEVKIGDEVTDFRGDKSIVTGWQQPHSPASTGRLFTSEDGKHDPYAGGYYPSVFNCEWVDREDRLS